MLMHDYRTTATTADVLKRCTLLLTLTRVNVTLYCHTYRYKARYENI